MARHLEYTPEIGNIICVRVSQGETIASISRDKTMPSHEAIYKWLSRDKTFADMYAYAREKRADTRFDKIDDYKQQVLTGKIPSDVARVVIDAERWQAGKENPRKYGERMTLAGDKDNPLVTVLATRLDAAIEKQRALENHSNVIDTTYAEVNDGSDLC